MLQDWQSQSAGDHRNRTLLLATHNVNDAFLRCDHFLVLQNGVPHEGRLLRRAEIDSAAELGRLLVTAHAVQQAEYDKTAAARPAGTAVLNSPPSASGDRVRLGVSVPSRPPRTLPSLLVRVDQRPDVVYARRARGSGHRALGGQTPLDEPRVERPAGSATGCELPVRGQGAIDPPLLQRLATEVIPSARLLTHSAADLHPWNLADMLFWEARVGQPTVRVDHYVSGRTIQADDPIVAALVGDDNDAALFSADTAWEIVVTQDFLRECNGATDARVVWLDCKQTPVPLVVRRVVKSLPGEYRFLMPDGLYREISADGFDPDPLVSAVWLGPFAASESEAVAAIGETLSKRNLELHLAEDRLEIRVFNNRQLPASRLWKYAEEIRALLAGKKLVDPSDVQIYQTPVAALQARQTWTHVGIDAASIEDLQPIAESISPYGLNVDPYYIEAMERLRRTVGPLAAVLIFVVSVAGFVVTVNFVLTSWQRVAQNRYQLGILKAGGMLARHITLLLVGQAALLGGLAGGAGIVVGQLAGQFVGDRIAEGWFCLSPGMAAIVFASTIAITVLGCLLGTVRTIRRQTVNLLVR